MMNEGLNAVTLVDGEYPTTTPYILAVDEQKAAVAGFIIKAEGKPKSYWGNLEERDMLHPVYGDFPKLRPGEPIPPKPDLLKDVNDELYERFVRDLNEQIRRDGCISKALAVFIIPLWVVGIISPDENLGLYLILGGIVIGVIGCIYDVCTKRDLLNEYKPAFEEQGIEVAEVSFISDFYTANYHGNSMNSRDHSTYIVFSVRGIKYHARQCWPPSKSWKKISCSDLPPKPSALVEYGRE